MFNMSVQQILSHIFYGFHTMLVFEDTQRGEPPFIIKLVGTQIH